MRKRKLKKDLGEEHCSVIREVDVFKTSAAGSRGKGETWRQNQVGVR